MIDIIKNATWKNSLGVQGFIKDKTDKPMRNATISIKGINKLYETTKTWAHYKIFLPAGKYELEVNCHGYKTALRNFTVLQDQIHYLNVTLVQSAGDVSAITGEYQTNSQSTNLSVGAQGESYISNDEMPNSQVKGQADIKELNPEPDHGNQDENDESNIKNDNSFVGIQGFVLDTSNHPVGGAQIFVVEPNITFRSDKEGKYMRELPKGKYTLKVDAPSYMSNVKYVEVNDLVNEPKIVMFTLHRDEHIWGLPRLVFVIIAGFTIVGIFALTTFCYMTCKPKKGYGLIVQQDDYDIRKDDNLFGTLITDEKKPITRPYFDDDDDDDEEDDIEEKAGFLSSSEDEIVLLQTSKYEKVPVIRSGNT